MFNNSLYSSSSLFTKPSLLSSLKAINWSTFLGNAQKTLGVINQAIPIVYQVKPIINNAKTVFKIANSLKSDTSNNISNNEPINQKKETNKTISSTNKPVFYL
jgi:hypothetical protein